MRLLLDTHAFLWFITEDAKLSASASAAIQSSDDVRLSLASVWEIAIKTRKGKLPLPKSIEEFIPEQLRANQVRILPIRLQHLYAVSRLPLLHHKDPFDRLLAAQALSNRMPLVSADVAHDSYGVTRIW
jgi:PIN domain nuclease of toxin-antitoxin system